MPPSLRLPQSFEELKGSSSRRNTFLLASIVAVAFGCGEVDIDDESPEETEPDMIPGETHEAAALPTPVDKARLPVCNREERVPQLVGTAEFYAPSALPGSGIFCTMGKGANSEAVRRLKLNLRYCHGATWQSLDGDNDYFGDGMVGAMLWIQREAGITQDGVYGPETFTKAMKWLYYTSAPFQRLGCYKFFGY